MGSHNNDDHGSEHQHHILPNNVGLRIFITLLVFTVITVAVARVDLGSLNFPVAMLIATVKALLVIFFFMGMEYDTNENRAMFFTSFAFFAFFIILTATDLFTRGDDVMVRGRPILKEVRASGELKYKAPWVKTAELEAHGKKLFEQNCVICHGAGGKGDGPAGAALNPHPRNFTMADGWKNGRKSSQIIGTLEKGLGNMPAFAAFPLDDKFALSYYVISFGPKAPEDTPEDLKKLGIDPSKPDGGLGKVEASKRISVDFAIERYVQPAK